MEICFYSIYDTSVTFYTKLMYTSLLSLALLLQTKAKGFKLEFFSNRMILFIVTKILKAHWQTNLYYVHTYATFCRLLMNPQEFQSFSG